MKEEEEEIQKMKFEIAKFEFPATKVLTLSGITYVGLME